jgi:protoporphyrinogen oxidase
LGVTRDDEALVTDLLPRERRPTRSPGRGYAVLGAGPAGLTAADVLARRGVRAVVYEADDQVGGIARTVERDGYRFDLGGHRFFTKVPRVQQLWEEMLGSEFLVRPRLSRIYFNGGFFAYPLRAEDVVRRLGIVETVRCGLSYLAACLRRKGEPETFEDWVVARFGRRLYDAFFKTYTEKVWGIPGSEIQSQWAVQRIKSLSFWTALKSALRLGGSNVTSLIEKFHYPRLGPGQMWEAFARRVESKGVPVRLEHRCVAVHHDGSVVTSVTLESRAGTVEHEVDGVLSSIPLSELVLSLEPQPPAHVVEAARRLRYRDLMVVAVMTTDPEPFPDNWIYLHDPGVRAGRVQNFGAWSADMTRPGTTCLGAEYFCFQGDDLWSLSEEEAIALAVDELSRIGLIDPAHVVGGARVHVPRAYPVYDSGYEQAVSTLREYVARFENLQTFGRNGLHRYNNQDHSMVTAILAAENLLDGAQHDVWAVNTDDVYLEEVGSTETFPLEVLERVGTPTTMALSASG